MSCEKCLQPEEKGVHEPDAVYGIKGMKWTCGECQNTGVLSIRDKFAMSALTGLLANRGLEHFRLEGGKQTVDMDGVQKVLAITAYRLADTMIAERRRPSSDVKE